MPIQTQHIPYPARESDYDRLRADIAARWGAGDYAAATSQILDYFVFRLDIELLRQLLCALQRCDQLDLAELVRDYLAMFYRHPLLLENAIQALEPPAATSLPLPETLAVIRQLFTPAIPRPRVSVCMVVRNEADILTACIDSVRPVMDELVVVDTGSDDGTPELLKQLWPEVVLIHHPWDNDFSQPRTLKLQHASGDWFFLLDADQQLEPSSVARLKQFFGFRPIGFNNYRVYVFNDSLVREHESIESFRDIWPLSHEIRYFGYGHAHPYHTRVPMHIQHLQLEGVWLSHSGFLNQQLDKHGKLDNRYLRMLKGLQDPTHTYPRLTYYHAYYQFNHEDSPDLAAAQANLESCLQAWREHGDVKPDLTWENASPTVIGLMLCRIWSRLGEDARIVAEYPAFTAERPQVNLSLFYAQALKRLGRGDEARQAALMALDPEQRVHFVHQGDHDWQPLALLLEIDLAARRPLEAMSWARLLINRWPTGQLPEGSANLHLVFAQLSRITGLDANGLLAALLQRSKAGSPAAKLNDLTLWLAQTPAQQWPLTALRDQLLSAGELALARWVSHYLADSSSVPPGPDRPLESFALRPLLRRLLYPSPDWLRFRAGLYPQLLPQGSVGVKG